MCIYCGTNKYRQIYKNHHGDIPKDENGRSYEIHHIDGDHSNNDPQNLKSVSIQEHYNIHYDQEDWGACFAIGKRMKTDTVVISEMASKVAKENAIRRVDEGTHNFLGGDLQHKRVKNGSHPFLGGNVARVTQRRLVENGTHNLLSGEIQRNTQKELLAKGIHPTQLKMNCTHCGRDFPVLNYKRWHGDKCKSRK